MIKPAQKIESAERIQDAFLDREKFLRLDKNERTYDFSPEFMASLKQKISSQTLTMYPELQPLYEGLARYLNLRPEEIYLSAGSEYSLKAIFEVYVEPHDKVLLHSPGYALSQIYAQLAQAEVITQEYQSDLNFDFEKYCQQVNSGLKMAILENPNGFVGNAYSFEQLEKFIQKAHSQGVLAVLDEAYFHFHDVSALNLIRQYDNLIVVRTFSKAWGAAGVRLGYLAACREVIHQIGKVRPMHEINYYALVTALHFLDNIQEMNNYVEEINRNKKFISSELEKRGIPFNNTKTNFILIKWPACEDIQSKFSEQGILIRRPFAQGFLQGWTRVTIGNKEQMKQLLSVVDKLFNKTTII